LSANAAIGLFGGTFDPVHHGHLAIIDGALQALQLAQLIVLPAGDPYQKAARTITAAGHRVAMLRHACAGHAQVTIDERETRRAGPTYTVVTLEELRGELGAQTPLVWLIGSDAYAGVERWHRAKELPRLCHFAVVTRPGDIHAGALRAGFAACPCDALLRQPAGGLTWLPIATPDVSSTALRARAQRGDSLRGLTPQGVCDYIETHRLYKE
jgi:nicotinate-nucleotide adenylyltransferase